MFLRTALVPVTAEAEDTTFAIDGLNPITFESIDCDLARDVITGERGAANTGANEIGAAVP
jgi:hypothetical protein